MGDKITLRGLLFITAITAIFLMVVRLAMLNHGQNVLSALVVMMLIPVSIFGLYAIAFLLLLPFGVIADLSRESIAPGTSPFAQDRLPEKQIDSRDPERAN